MHGWPLVRHGIFPGQALTLVFSLCWAPSGRRGLGEMDGCALFQFPIEVMRKLGPFANTCANCAAESVVAGVGSMFSVFARAL